eukprot:5008447-Pyramimonas_sp.AAC.1
MNARGPRLAPQDGSSELNSAHFSRNSCPTAPQGLSAGSSRRRNGASIRHTPHARRAPWILRGSQFACQSGSRKSKFGIPLT